MKISNSVKLIICLATPQLAGAVGSLFTMSAIPTWYATLTKPYLAPPNWVFGPVWTLLFLLMGIAAFLVWRTGLERKDTRVALAVFMGQLALNVLWSVLFFGMRSLGGAFVELVILWAAILATILVFARISRTAAWLLVPYLAWVSFAGYLNFSYWLIN